MYESVYSSCSGCLEKQRNTAYLPVTSKSEISSRDEVTEQAGPGAGDWCKPECVERSGGGREEDRDWRARARRGGHPQPAGSKSLNTGEKKRRGSPQFYGTYGRQDYVL